MKLPVLALKARRSKAQGEGRKAAEALGWNNRDQALKGRNRQAVPPFQGLLKAVLYPGFRRPLPRAPSPWALLHRAFGAAD